MNKVIEVLLKGIVTLIWFIATVVTTIILSPFLLVVWLSKLINNSKKGDDMNDFLK